MVSNLLFHWLWLFIKPARRTKLKNVLLNGKYNGRKSRTVCLWYNLYQIFTSKHVQKEDIQNYPGRRGPKRFPIWFSLLIRAGYHLEPWISLQISSLLCNYRESSLHFILIVLLPPSVSIWLHYCCFGLSNMDENGQIIQNDSFTAADLRRMIYENKNASTRQSRNTAATHVKTHSRFYNVKYTSST